MPKKIRFEWDLPDALVEAVAPAEIQLVILMKNSLANLIDGIINSWAFENFAQTIFKKFDSFFRLFEVFVQCSYRFRIGKQSRA